ncbi:MAG: TonB-dependent receptor [Flavobacteriaceae bacterium]|nr:TonB-dependent receptor [Flavobacteriaceae bacterium]
MRKFYNAIPKVVLKEQVVTNLNDALKNATGITRLWESTGRGGDGAEYYSMRGFAVQPTMVNGMPSINNGGLDPSNVETIEVIKGPSGTLYGGNLISYGGLINIVTKVPYDSFGGEIGYITGSYGLNRFTADVNTPVSKNLFVRINTALHSENSFQDAGFNKSFFLAPSIKFIANDKLTFLINSEYKSSESANAPMVFLSRYAPISFDNIDLFEKNYENSFTSNNLTIKNPSFGMQSQMLYKINNNWTSQTILSRSNTKTNGYYHYLWDSSNGDEFTRFISKRNGETNATDIQQNFIGDFKIGKIRNRMVIGVDYLNKQIQNNSTGWSAHGVVSLVNSTDSGILTTQAVDNTLLNSTEGVSTAETKILSAYLSDVINIIPSLSAMLSLRIDNFSGRPNYWTTEDIKSQTSVSPKLGLVYQPIQDKLSIFANYMNGFVNLDPVEVSDIDGNNPTIKIFDPEEANQFEFGAKANLFKDYLAITASYYDIKVSNKVMADPNNQNNSIQGGEVTSNGLEVSLVGNVAKGLNVIAGFSHNKSEVTKDAEDGGYLGFRPEEAGPGDPF